MWSPEKNKATGKIRQLLCFSCNSAIGHSKEDINILREIIKYLKRHKNSKRYNAPILKPRDNMEDRIQELMK